MFRAPVPAYILDKASPFSAHSSRWFVHSCIEASHSRRISPRYCSSVVFDRTSSTKLVLSRLVMARHQKALSMHEDRRTYQSRQFVRKTPFCSLTISSVEASHMVKPNLSMLSLILSILLWKASEHRLSRILPRPFYLR